VTALQPIILRHPHSYTQLGSRGANLITRLVMPDHLQPGTAARGVDGGMVIIQSRERRRAGAVK
jgi:hypothetical protein